MTAIRRTGLCLLLLMALAAAPPLARAEILSDELPGFGGATFAAEMIARDADGALKSQAVIWNLDGDLASAYVYAPETGQLKALYVARAFVAAGDGSWLVSFNKGKPALHIRETRDGRILMNGKRTELRRIREGEVVALRQAWEPVEKLSACPFACAFGGCCQCCFCVHDAIGVPDILDALCCGFGC